MRLHPSDPALVCQVVVDDPPERVTTSCGGKTPRMLVLVRDAQRAIVRRSTHPVKFSQLRGSGEALLYRCSQCGGAIAVLQHAKRSWKENVDLAGSSLHTPACAKRRKRKGAPAAAGGSLQQSVKRKKARSAPPLPTDAGALRKAFVFPPLSLIRMDLGPFQKRTQQWLKTTGMDDSSGRDAELINYGPLSDRGGTSRFNPTLAEGVFRFFCPDPERAGRPVVVLDICAGGVTRGVVASHLGLLYVGIDCSKRQVEANSRQMGACDGCEHLPLWVHGDGEDCRALFRRALTSRGLDEDTPADLVFTCPPYWNLEQYDPKNKKDLSSAPTYERFLKKYRAMLGNATALLRSGHCAALVVGNVRGKDGTLHDLHGDTKSALSASGSVLYNDAVIATPVVGAGITAAQTGRAAKLVPCHQHLVVRAARPPEPSSLTPPAPPCFVTSRHQVACKDAPLSVERAKQFHIDPSAGAQ